MITRNPMTGLTRANIRMRTRTLLKAVSLATGTYRLARLTDRHLLRREEREVFESEVALYRSMRLDGALCFDVGANIGTRAEALLAAGARVVAFEPLPGCIRELQARCAPYAQRLTVIQAALGATAGIATLHVRSASTHSSLVENWEPQVAKVATLDVPILTLDVAIARYGHPAYCKIDVEGYELQVLEGLTSAIPVVSLEFHLNEKDIEKTRGCAARLQQLGGQSFNVMPPERPRLALPEWRPLGEFATWFPEGAAHVVGSDYGDLLVSTRPVA